MKQYILCLQELPVFKALHNNEFIEEICKRTQRIQIKKGEVLFHQGDEANYLYLVKSGMIKLVRYDEEGNERILDMIGPRECVGETAFWSNRYEFEATALEDTYLCAYNFNHFKMFILGNPVYSEKIIKYLGQKLDDNMFRSRDSEGLLVKDKLLRQLEKLAADHGELLEDGYSLRIKVPITQKDLANMVGASRLMVNNALKELRAENAIDKEERYYIVKSERCLINNFVNKFKNMISAG